MPDQIRRILVIIVIVVAGIIITRRMFVPESFGVDGHYRAVAVDSAIAQKIQYAGHKICSECHDDIAAEKGNSYHRNVNCEVCHGPAASHVETLGDVLPDVPRGREHCILCHEYNPSRPTGFPQINPVMHNPVKPCVSCHNPHAPDPPRVPGDCSACHTGIARTKALSPHALLECIECHVTPDEHLSHPRTYHPGKPFNRDDCGKCHDKKAESDRFIPRIELVSHGEGYLCWECHFPHYPEVSR